MKKISAEIKSKIRWSLRRILGIKSIFVRIDNWQQVITNLENALQQTNNTMHTIIENMTASYNEQIKQLENKLYNFNVNLELQKKCNINNRFAIKKAHGIAVRVVFLIEESSVIKNVKTIIDALNKDERFEVILVNLWYKVYDKNDYYYKRPTIETVLDVSKYSFFESYDEIEDKWLVLESLHPDYVFFARPYDFYRNESYHISTVAKYARTCYVPYGIQTIGGEVEQMVLTPECENLSYFFMDNKIRRQVIEDAFQGTKFEKEGHLVYLGYPGMDMLREADTIKNINQGMFNILWLPRWNNTENNCHFFEYKDVLLDYVSTKERCCVTLRPHPLCFGNFINTGEMTEAELLQLKDKYNAPNRIDESGNYIEAFAESSVLVADETSLIAEYFLTGKPIVFCEKQTHFSFLMEKLIEGCYVVHSEIELVHVLEQLQTGNDYLKNKREELTKNLLLDYGDSAGRNIRDEIWQDFVRSTDFK